MHKSHVPRTTDYAPNLVAHLDMNSYFASVEQQANPLLRGRPLGVCAYLHPGGCVIAASIEAKERGMKVGMRMEDAKRLVPDAVFVQNEPAKYRSTTSRIFSILHEVSDRVEHYSIDEAFLDLKGWYRDPAEAAWALTRVRQRIYSEVGEWLRCSIGIAPTRFLAKLGSDIQKPSGLTVITAENIDRVLADLDLEDICGIGRRMRRRIEALGYHTPLELKYASVSNLMHAFGKMGYLLWAKLHLHDIEDVVSESPKPKSVGHSYCVPNRVNKEKKVVPVLTKLAEKAARRLRAQGLAARLVIVSVGFRGEMRQSGPWGGGGDSQFIRLDEVTSDSFTLINTTMQLLQGMWDGKRPVSFLAVTFTEFGEPSGQLCFDLARRPQRVVRGDRDNASRITDHGMLRVQRASQALDAIKDRYGDEAIMLGRQFGITVDEAPDRVGFRKTDGVETTTNPQ
ncbi:hypothetical protein GF380_01450 [Candidatus Uhrbacteria bacterium]|nr:hypothetical protein [Candidatus Uhrbacteria bacterium]MBD3283945.1 hypothetical protein [Candidatus Uhrbacteria bacterium]